MGWISPTGFNDRSSKWNSETNAYDGDTGTRASTHSNSYYLELTHAAFNCSKVQIYAATYYAFPVTYSDPQITISVYYSSAWHTIFTGTITKSTWTEKSIGSTESITAARVHWENIGTGHDWDTGELYEFQFYEEPSTPTVAAAAATSVGSTTARVNGSVTDDGGATVEARFRHREVLRDDFEWGSDGDPLDDDGGDIDWTITAAGSSKAEIDAQHYSGTRSARIYRDGTNNPSGYFAQSPITSTQIISFRLRTDDNYFWFEHGNGSKVVFVYIYEGDQGDHLGYFDGTPHDTGKSITNDTWYLLEIRNVNWTAGTYDIYVDGVCVKSSATMYTGTEADNYVVFTMNAGTATYWVDNVAVAEAWTETSWDGGSYETDDTYYEDLTGLTLGTEYEFQTQGKNSAGEGDWSSSLYFDTTTVVIFTTQIGLNASLTRQIEWNPSLETVVGLVAKLFRDNLETLTTAIGLKATLTKTAEIARSIKTQVGLSPTLTRSIDVSPALDTKVGLLATLTRVIESAPLLSIAIGLKATLTKSIAVSMASAIGVVGKSLQAAIEVSIKTITTLKATLTRQIECSPEIKTEVGLAPSLTQAIEVNFVTQTGLSATLTKVLESNPSLITQIGLSAELTRAIEVSPTMATQVGLVGYLRFLGLAEIATWVSWDGTGNYDGVYDEITADVLSIAIRRGRQSELNIAEIGTLELTLTDPDRKYSPENATSPLYGSLLPRLPIKVEASLGGKIQLFHGFIDKFVCHPKLDKQTSYLYAVDGMDFLSRADVSGTLYKNQATGTLVGYILDDAGWDAAKRDLDTGDLTVPIGFWSGISALTAIRNLEKSEVGSFAYIDNEGNFVWEDANARTGAASEATFEDNYQGLKYEYGSKSIYNIVKIKMKKWELQPLAEIWRLEEEPTITAGASKTFWANFDDIADTITDPVATTDYLAYTEAGGGGSSRTTLISIVTTKFAQGAKLVVTNGAGVKIYLNLLRLRGELYDSKTTTTIKAEDATSQTAYQERTLTIETPFLTDTAKAQTYADAALADYKDPSPEVMMTIMASPTGGGDEIIHRQLSDKIRVINTRLGLDRYFFIEKIEYTFREGGQYQEAKWTLSEA